MFRTRFRGKSRGAQIAAIVFAVGYGGWELGVEPAMARAEKWSGTIVEMDMRKPFFGSSRNGRRRHKYYWTVRTAKETRDIEVPGHLYKKAHKGQFVVKEEGERWPEIR